MPSTASKWSTVLRGSSGGMPPEMGGSSSHDRPRLNDAEAVAFARPDVLVSAGDPAASQLAELAATYYGFWNNGSPALFKTTVSPAYTDHTLPAGREQGPFGLATAGAAFFAAFPDGRVKVLQQILTGDRVVSHLRVTGTFTGTRKGVSGAGQSIDYLATDIMRVSGDLIVENWHVEDHETLHRQLSTSV